jgi:hypothetical protein
LPDAAGYAQHALAKHVIRMDDGWLVHGWLEFNLPHINEAHPTFLDVERLVLKALPRVATASSPT